MTLRYLICLGRLMAQSHGAMNVNNSIFGRIREQLVALLDPTP